MTRPRLRWGDAVAVAALLSGCVVIERAVIQTDHVDVQRSDVKIHADTAAFAAQEIDVEQAGTVMQARQQVIEPGGTGTMVIEGE